MDRRVRDVPLVEGTDDAGERDDAVTDFDLQASQSGDAEHLQDVRNLLSQRAVLIKLFGKERFFEHGSSLPIAQSTKDVEAIFREATSVDNNSTGAWGYSLFHKTS